MTNVDWCRNQLKAMSLSNFDIFQGLQGTLEHNQSLVLVMPFLAHCVVPRHHSNIFNWPQWRLLWLAAFTFGVMPSPGEVPPNLLEANKPDIPCSKSDHNVSPTSRKRIFGHVIDFLCSGLLLLRTWIFSGRKKLLAWLFSISFSAYIAALSWGTALFMMSYSKQSGEACLNSLSAARHLIGVSTTGFSPFQVIHY